MAGMLKPDLEARAASWPNQLRVRSINDLREAENLPRIEDPRCDLPWMPLNEAPVGTQPGPAGSGDPSTTDPSGDALAPAPQENP